MSTRTKGTAEFFVSNKSEWELNWKIARHFLPHARVRELRNAILLPLRLIGEGGLLKQRFEGGVCDGEGYFVAGRRRSFWTENANFSCLRAYDVPRERILFRNEDVIFGGIIFDHYGHLLTDSTARLWYVATHPGQNRKIVFLKCPHKAKWSPEDAIPFLELAGIDRNRIEIVEVPTRFRSMTIPEEAVYSLDAVRPEWISFFDAVRSRVEPSPFKKVYFSRAKFKKRDVFNEDLFEDYWRDRGFHIVYPEDCTLREEVAYLSGADELVATIGTLSHNFLFAKPGARATVLLRTGVPLRLQLLIGKARGLNCDYVESFRNVLPTSHNDGSFFLFPTPLFREFLGSRDMPDFDSGKAVAPLQDEQISGYARRWFHVTLAKSEVSRMLRGHGFSEEFVTSLERTEDVEEKVRILSRFVRAELIRNSGTDMSIPAGRGEKRPGIVRRAKNAIHVIRNTWLHPQHDLF